ncbi:Fic family protein [Thiohalocapsa sp. ML1]|uniref:Fic family protein n=1 Tax=Thiohalocapsa sp. ML1 TaxID=1431688 RepID=UPI000A6B1E5D|nr:Fic family protein [Thiohalocapsa sp. ML1]
MPRFLERYASVYVGLGKAEGIIGAAAAHHRLLWIPPFLDGNGRVARLLSHALLLDALDTGSVWSIARGLARSVRTYKAHLAACDLPRRNDLDGRGHLSEEALADFTRFFLETCLDQVRFMEALAQPERLRERILLWSDDAARLGERPPKAGRVLEAILYRGELPRGEVPDLLAASERSARRVVAALAEQGVVHAASTRAPLRIAFPARLAARWLPGLFPEAP